MTYAFVDSSMINLVGYDEKTKVLEVRFVNFGQKYRYFNVPKKEYKGLMKATSKGTYMRNNIIDRYDYAKVEGGRRSS